AAVYWLERLRDGRCYASNATIGKIVGSSSSGVANALVRLKDKGYVQAFYNENNTRKSITTLVHLSKNPYSNEEGGLTQMSNIGNKKESKITSETMAEITKIYKLWCIYMIVEPELRSDGTPDARSAALLAATKSYRLTPKRRDAVARRLKDAGYDQLVRAIKSISQSPVHRDGIDNRGEEGTWKATLEWLCGSYEKVEEWANKYPKNKSEE
ncbi:MAG: hypothetical protein WBC13_11380, partial [Dokdonella sp.]